MEKKKKELNAIDYPLYANIQNMRRQVTNDGKTFYSHELMKLVDKDDQPGYHLGNPNNGEVKWKIVENEKGEQILKPDF